MKSSGVGGGGAGVASAVPKVLVCWKSGQKALKIRIKIAPNVVWLQKTSLRVCIKTH